MDESGVGVKKNLRLSQQVLNYYPKRCIIILNSHEICIIILFFTHTCKCFFQVEVAGADPDPKLPCDQQLHEKERQKVATEPNRRTKGQNKALAVFRKTIAPR